jgi:biotin operon repressor
MCYRKNMSLIKYIERLRRMDLLISLMATGTPEEFAEKIGIRRSTLFESIQEMRGLGVDIKYSHERQSYYYADDRRVRVKVVSRVQTGESENRANRKAEEIL